MTCRLKPFLFFIALFLVLLAATGCAATQSSTGGSSSADGDAAAGVKIAPDFRVQTLSGEPTTLGSLKEKGKPIVINFAASWCGPCEIEAPVLVKAYQKYKDRVTFFGLAVKDSEEAQRAFIQKHGLPFPVGMDPDGKVHYTFIRAAGVQISGIPMTFFMSADGNIADVFIGPISEKTFDQKLGLVLPN